MKRFFWMLLPAMAVVAIALLFIEGRSVTGKGSSATYEEAFQQSISRELQSLSSQRDHISESTRRATFDQQQKAIVAAQLERHRAARARYGRDKQQAWEAYYPLPEACVQATDPDQLDQCAQREREAREAFELFYDPGEIQLR